MNYYENEMRALERAGRLRERRVRDTKLLDFASNDYLGLGRRRDSFEKAYRRVESLAFRSPGASMLVNGYHPLHEEFEATVASLNGFESALTLGSGFLANISLLEALPRRGDLLLVDEEYHASGVLAAKKSSARVEFFRHNDPGELGDKIASYSGRGRVIVAVEGVYSMSGELLHPAIFDIAQETGSILVVDEAHSCGVLGEKLLGVFDLYGIEVKANHVKMGTLGKAYGSYGAYILASSHISDYLLNRAKPLIYSTALSLFDTALALENILYISENSSRLGADLNMRRELVKEVLGMDIRSSILSIDVSSDKRVMELASFLASEGFAVGAIRRPTVKSPLLRLNVGRAESPNSLRRVLNILKETL